MAADRVVEVQTVRLGLSARQPLKIWVKLLPPILKIKSSQSQSQSMSPLPSWQSLLVRIKG